MRTETTPQRAPGPPLLIGEAPPPRGLGPLGAFDCQSGDNLAGLLSEAEDYRPHRGYPRTWTRAEALVRFERRNLLAVWPGPAKSGKGSAFPPREAAAAAAALADELPPGRRVILAGQRVADAFGLRLPIGVEARSRGCRWQVIPHPSGSTRSYNRTEIRAAAGAALLGAIEASAAEAVALVRLSARSWYHYGRGQFLGDLAEARAALRDAAARVFRWCATSIVPVRAHEGLSAILAYRRCRARGAEERVALRAAAIDSIHDRHEPLAGDLASPFKPLLADDWREYERSAGRATADLYSGCAAAGSLLLPLSDSREEAQAQEQAHLADLDSAAVEAAWWHPVAHERVLEEPLCSAAREARSPEDAAPLLGWLDDLGRQLPEWCANPDIARDVLRAADATLPALPLSDRSAR